MTKLISTPMVHTPGIFRWFQHRFETEGQKAHIAALFGSSYGLRYSTARLLLSGKIPVLIDEDAGTVSFEGGAL